MDWKVGDWCYFRFELHQIGEISAGRVTSVDDGVFSTGGHDLSADIFPQTMLIKSISDEFASAYRKIREKAGSQLSLNYPGLYGRLVTRWKEACVLTDKKAIEYKYQELWEFERTVEMAIDAAREVTVESVPLFRE